MYSSLCLNSMVLYLFSKSVGWQTTILILSFDLIIIRLIFPIVFRKYTIKYIIDNINKITNIP